MKGDNTKITFLDVFGAEKLKIYTSSRRVNKNVHTLNKLTELQRGSQARWKLVYRVKSV